MVQNFDAQIVSAYLSGVSAQELSRRYNTSNIRKILLTNGVTLRTKKEAKALQFKLSPTDFTHNGNTVYSCGNNYYYLKNGKKYKIVFTKCDLCGKEAFSFANNRSKHHFCSRKCMKTALAGEGHPQWCGGRRKYGGYTHIYIPEHPCANGKYVLEHRLVIEKHLGRFLTEEEVVHHINFIKTDNRLENLYLCSSETHNKIHSNLFELVPALLDSGAIRFDALQGRYVIGEKP